MGSWLGVQGGQYTVVLSFPRYPTSLLQVVDDSPPRPSGGQLRPVFALGACVARVYTRLQHVLLSALALHVKRIKRITTFL